MIEKEIGDMITQSLQQLKSAAQTSVAHWDQSIVAGLESFKQNVAFLENIVD